MYLSNVRITFRPSPRNFHARPFSSSTVAEKASDRLLLSSGSRAEITVNEPALDICADASDGVSMVRATSNVSERRLSICSVPSAGDERGVPAEGAPGKRRSTGRVHNEPGRWNRPDDLPT